MRNSLIFLALLAALVTGLVLAIPSLRGVGHAIAHMQTAWLGVAIVLELLSCVGYVIAFLQVFEHSPVRLGARVALTELAFGSALPLGGAGSIAVGGWLLVQRGAPLGRVAQRSVVLFLLTSAINVITLVAVGCGLFLGLLPGSPRPLLSLVPAAIGAIVLAAFVMLSGLAPRPEGSPPVSRFRSLLLELGKSSLETRRLLTSPDWRLSGAIGYLWFDIGVLVACFAALGAVPPLASIVLAYQLGYLSNLVPIPGGIGILDASLIGLLVLYGVDPTSAVAAALVYHAMVLWIPALWGTGAFLLLQRMEHPPTGWDDDL